MADHLWFVPVTGGSRRAIESVSRPGYGGTDDTNVQWDFSNFPAHRMPQVEIACLNMSCYTGMAGGVEPYNEHLRVPGKLLECYGSWGWRSCASGDPLRIITGGQLMVGTVFSRKLRRPDVTGADLSWLTAEVWAKFRVRASSMDVLDGVFITLDDSSGSHFISSQVSGISVDTWTVGYCYNYDNWDGWDSENLRVTMNFQGTSDPTKVGKVTVDVEWFAIRLSDEDPDAEP